MVDELSRAFLRLICLAIAFSQADVGDGDFTAILLGDAVPSPVFNTDMLPDLQSGMIAVHQRRVAELLVDVQHHHGMNFPNCVFLRFSSSV
jgi:hypothetical protein